MLTREKLYYVEPKVEEEEEEEEEEGEEEDILSGNRNSIISKVSLYQDSAYDLHYGENWFHGKLKV